MKQSHKLLTLTLHLAILGTLAYKYGAHSTDHPVACVFAVFSTLVIIRTLFR